jgi:hypothetical protein
VLEAAMTSHGYNLQWFEEACPAPFIRESDWLRLAGIAPAGSRAVSTFRSTAAATQLLLPGFHSRHHTHIESVVAADQSVDAAQLTLPLDTMALGSTELPTLPLRMVRMDLPSNASEVKKKANR